MLLALLQRPRAVLLPSQRDGESHDTELLSQASWRTGGGLCALLASAAHYPILEKEEEEGCSFSKERTFQSRDESQQIAVW
jgi:hypothetical protein